MTLTRRDALVGWWCSACGIAYCGGMVCGCSVDHKHAPPPPAPQPKPAPPPAEPSEGRLIRGHWQHVGAPLLPIDEPLVPSGTWNQAFGCEVWWPDYLPAVVISAAMLEMAQSVPAPGTRVILLPGPFATTFNGRAILAWGQFNRGAWDGADVIHLGVSEQWDRDRGLAYLPALEHELDHQRDPNTTTHAMEATP